VGTLKGGGPGAAEGGELGLSQLYYDGIVDLSTYMCTQSYDKFTNGAKVLLADPSAGQPPRAPETRVVAVTGHAPSAP